MISAAIIKNWREQNVLAGEIILAFRERGYIVGFDLNLDLAWLDRVAHMICSCQTRVYSGIEMAKRENPDVRFVMCHECQKWIYYERKGKQNFLPFSN